MREKERQREREKERWRERQSTEDSAKARTYLKKIQKLNFVKPRKKDSERTMREIGIGKKRQRVKEVGSFRYEIRCNLQ